MKGFILQNQSQEYLCDPDFYDEQFHQFTSDISKARTWTNQDQANSACVAWELIHQELTHVIPFTK
tara:strand:- start:654 stop:851 length:198 start_codon:yes stop_codon:yes gene_type:complete